jgi:hypothetical protein
MKKLLFILLILPFTLKAQLPDTKARPFYGTRYFVSMDGDDTLALHYNGDSTIWISNDSLNYFAVKDTLWAEDYQGTWKGLDTSDFSTSVEHDLVYAADSANIVWFQDTVSLIGTKHDIDTVSSSAYSHYNSTANPHTVTLQQATTAGNTTNQDVNLTAGVLQVDGTDTSYVEGDFRIGAYTLPNIDGSANQILTTNGSGSVSWGDEYGDSDVNDHLSGGTGIGYSSGTISLSHLGIEDLTDPGADKIMFWDNGAGATKWLVANTGLSISGTNLNCDITQYSDSDVDDHLSGGNGISYSTGTIALEALTSDWDIGDGKMIQTDKIRARDGDGLALYEDGGSGIFVEDGGNVGIGTDSPTEALDVDGSGKFSGDVDIANGELSVAKRIHVKDYTGGYAFDYTGNYNFLRWIPDDDANPSYGGIQIRNAANDANKFAVTKGGKIYTSNILQVDGTGTSYIVNSLAVGQTTASEALDVDGNIKVSGRMEFTESDQTGSDTLTFDLSASAVHEATLTGNATLDYSNAATGTYIIKVTQDGTGGRTVSWVADSWQASGGSVTIDSDADATTILSCFYDTDASRMIITEIQNLSDL